MEVVIQIIIDTREGKKTTTGALTFNHPYVTGIIRQKLDVGDYRAKYSNGKESVIVAERKSITDLWGTLSNRKRYERFRAEIERATSQNIRLVLYIEGSYGKIKKGIKARFRSGDSIAKQIRTLYLKYGVEYHYCVDREQMALQIADEFEYYGEKKLWV